MSGKKFLGTIAFIATVCIAFALMFRAIFESNPTVVNALTKQRGAGSFLLCLR